MLFGFAILFDLIFNPKASNNEFDHKLFDFVKERLSNDIKMLDDNPKKKSLLKALSTLGDSPSSYGSLGFLEEIDKITPENLYTYYKQVINTDYVDIYVVGNLDMDEVSRIVGKYAKFNVIKNHEVDMYVSNVKRKPVILSDKSSNAQSNIVVLVNLNNLTEDEKKYAANMYNLILGGGSLETKLYQKLRVENSLCYNVGSMYQKYDGLIIITTSVDINKSNLAVQLIKTCLKEMKTNISDEELDSKLFENLHNTLISGFDEVKKLVSDYVKKHWSEEDGEMNDKALDSKIKKSLGGVIGGGFDPIYLIAQRLVKHSNDEGFLVGSRGSVGSSFVATMMGITEVNPLPAHYRCLKCKNSIFKDDNGNDLGAAYSSGFDLPDKVCPKCGEPMYKDGQDMPFATFLGFNADKVPDIDLNFSDLNQASAHEYTKVLFGVDNVYRAGTIGTVAEKTAYGYAKGYAETLGIDNEVRSAELERIARGCGGVKRTTGQHPGGIIVIPRDYDVFDFTPYQYPADDLSAEWRTTHFDFHAIHDNVLKFDILGHVDPTVIRMLQDLTGVDPKTIPTNDTKVMSLFTTSDALGVDLSYINCKSGALGLPEFGTTFVRSMLDQTKPQTFNDLVIISGLSHGTDVYLGNAETLIKNGTCTLKEVIGCRDDIMVYLIEKGLPNKDAFDIMECVRKGKSPAVFPEKKYEELMKEYNVPQWYIDSCKKIKYMFPKAHAVAYVLSAIRVAWWKLYYPREYYAVYFSTRCDFFDIETLVAGKDAILSRRKEIEMLRENRQSSNKDEGLWDVFEIALEMIDRGFHFSPLNLEKSDANKFILDPDDPSGLLPPFSSVDSLGESVANTVIEARKHGSFLSKEDVIKRTKLNNSHIKQLTKMGVFDGMQEENQLSLF